MSLFENVIMIIIMVIMALMFQNVVTYTSESKMYVRTIGEIESQVQIMSDAIEEIVINSNNINDDIENYINNVFNSEFLIEYELECDGIFINVRDSMGNAEVNIFKTISREDGV